MELILDLKQELTLAGLIVAITVGILKGFFVSQFKKFCEHFKKEQKVYYVTCGIFTGFFIFYSTLTVKKQVNLIQSKFNKYENLKKNINDGSITKDYDLFIRFLGQRSVREFYILQKDKMEVNFPSRKKWEDTHLSNIFGIVYVNSSTKEVFFQYKSVVGKNKFSNQVLFTEDYIRDNPKLFKNFLSLAEADKQVFLNGDVNKCIERALFKNLQEIEKQLKNGVYEPDVCDFYQTFFYTTGRVEGINQKTFNEINSTYYMLIPYAENGNKSKLYFYYAFNSSSATFLKNNTYHSILSSFLERINVYKTKIKSYEEHNKAD